MGRWEPDAAGRLMAAAMELYRERGFDQTTVADIAARAGVTERTFFRHFTDKREVLFAGQDRLLAVFVEGLRAAPAGATPMKAVEAAVLATAPFFADHAWSTARARVIEQSPSLMERELYKMTTVATALRAELVARGVDPITAGLAADAGVTAFKFAFERWVSEGETRGMSDLIVDTLGRLRDVIRL